MVYWIRKCAALLGCTVFFALFFVGLAGSGEYSIAGLGGAFMRALFGASLAWVVGIVIADILLKAVLSDIAGDRNALVEGGLMQRIHSLRDTVAPGGPGMPFSGVTAIGAKREAGEKLQ